MTDTERLDWLDKIMRLGKAASCPPGGWYIREQPGQVIISDEHAQGTDIRGAIDRFKDHCDHVSEALARMNEDDVRASALRYEDQQRAATADNEARV